MSLQFLEALSKANLSDPLPVPAQADVPEMSANNAELGLIDPAKGTDKESIISVVEDPSEKAKPKSAGTFAIKEGISSVDLTTTVEDIVDQVMMILDQKYSVVPSDTKVVTAMRQDLLNAVQAVVSEITTESVNEVEDAAQGGLAEIEAAVKATPRLSKLFFKTTDGKLTVDARPRGGSGMWEIESNGKNAWLVTFNRMRMNQAIKYPLFAATTVEPNAKAVVKAIMKWAKK